jgi:hypothetical protein
MRFDSAGARFLLGLLVVVSLVQAEVLRTPRSSGTLEHDGIERLATHVFVVNIGAGGSHSQRDALAIGQDMPFGAELGAIGGVGTCEPLPFGALMLALSSEVQSHSNPTL